MQEVSVSTRDLFSTIKRNEGYVVVMTNMDLKELHRQMGNVAVMLLAFRLKKAESVGEIREIHLDLLGANEDARAGCAVVLISSLLENPGLPVIWVENKDVVLNVLIELIGTSTWSPSMVAEGLLDIYEHPPDGVPHRALPAYMLSYLPEYIRRSRGGISP